VSRRLFLARAVRLACGLTATGISPRFAGYRRAAAETVGRTDARVTAESVPIDGMPGLGGYFAKPKTPGKYPAIVVVHDNRGLDEHIRSFTRRLAAEGYLALAVDFGTVTDKAAADGRTATEAIEGLKREDIVTAGRAAVAMLALRPDCTKKIGVSGFGWGGLALGYLILAEPAMAAAVSYYGRQPLYFLVDEYKLINAAMMFHYASRDIKINEGIVPFEIDLRDAGRSFETYSYPNVKPGFDDEDGDGYDKDAAVLAWGRTVGFFKKHLV
jgi:carboxymethylenebutenolidase